MKIGKATLAAVMLAALTFVPSARAHSASATGQVTKVDGDAGKVTIKHGPIKAMDMPDPMTMVYRVKDPAELKALKAGDPLTTEVIVTNTGEREGDEVVQLYLSFPNVAGSPIRALRGFRRIHLKAGESQKVGFELKERDLGMVAAAGKPIVAEGMYSVSIGGGQPNTGATTVAGTFQVKGTKALPE